jgi:hypothetical protein
VDRIRGAFTKKRLRITIKKRVQKINPTCFFGFRGGGGVKSIGGFGGLRTAITI